MTTLEEKRIAEIGERLRTQNNRATAHPIFAVQQKRRIWGLDPDYTDIVAWVDTANDFDVADEEEHARLEAEYEDTGLEPDGWRRTGYVDTWEFVTACLTEAGAEAYIEVNGHNLHEPRIYAYSAWRNEEWEFMRTLFASGNFLTLLEDVESDLLDGSPTSVQSISPAYEPTEAELERKETADLLKWLGTYPTFCPECGPGVATDEDGLCISCGCSAIGSGVTELFRHIPPGEGEE